MEAKLGKLLATLATLVGFPTVSRQSNLKLVGYIRDFLSARGACVEILPNADGTKAAIHAKLGEGDGGILLSGHTDVVPVDGQVWSSDPFRLTRSAERLVGRGAADMKGFLACMLTLVDEIHAAPSRPLHLAFSYDEEIGCKGVGALLDRIRVGAEPDLCIVGEPSGMRVVASHKGKLAARVGFTGVPCHSSLAPRGANAIHMAADAIAGIRRLQGEIATNGMCDEGFEIPHTTLSVGMIAGGVSLNIVPDRCSFDFEIRNLPADPAEPHMRRIEAMARQAAAEVAAGRAGASLDFEILASYPGLQADADHRWVKAVCAATGTTVPGKVSYGSEAGLFAGLGGFPVVICGPGRIDEAHRPDEYVEIDQLATCMQVLERLAMGDDPTG